MQFKKILFGATLLLPMYVYAATCCGYPSSPVLTNGSFENGFSGWAQTSSTPIYPVSIETYGTTDNTFGEAVPRDNADSPFAVDPSGTKFAYFVKDDGLLTLSQSFVGVNTERYLLGFSTYVLLNGSTNGNGATFSAFLDGRSIYTLNVSSLPVQLWRWNQVFIDIVPGLHSLEFRYIGQGVPAIDLALDRVSIVGVPEPTTYLLMLFGVAVLFQYLRIRNRA